MRIPSLAHITIILLFTSVLHAQQKAPDFTLKNLSKDDFTLSERLEDGPILIDFWATWCKPCVEAMPHLSEIHKEYQEQGLQVVTISIDNPRSQSKIKPFIRAKGYDFEVLLDGDSEVRQLFGGTVIPLSVLIDQEGVVRYRHLGYVPGDENELRAQIEKLFNNPKNSKSGE